jgi:hypothetical protein
MLSVMKPHLLALLLILGPLYADTVEPVLAPNTNRPWLGKDLWANPAEDWHLSSGRIENRF